MGIMEKRTFLLLLAVSMISSFLFVPLSTGTAGAEDIPYTVHAPFHIDSDSDLAFYAPEGNGTVSSPYRFSYLDIDASGHSAAFYIGNTTLPFIIERCNLHDADVDSLLGTSFFACFGIVLSNVTNAVVQDNQIHDSKMGVLLYRSDGNTMQNNTMYRNSIFTFVIYNSDDNTVRDNDMSFTIYGVEMFNSSDHNSFIDNTITETDIGFYASECTNSTFEGNVVDTFLSYGFLISQDVNGTVVRNNSASDGFNGLYSGVSEGITISDNEFRDCNYGVHLGWTEGALVSGNTIERCESYGIILTFSGNASISGNDVRECGIGLHLMYSDSSDVRGNTIGDCTEAVNSTASCDGTIDDNVLSTSDNGLVLFDGSDDNVITNNTVKGNFKGMSLNGSQGNRIEGNSILSNGDGVYMDTGSDENEIFSNFFQYNYCGIYLWEADRNVIYDNALIDNSFGLDLDGADHNEITGNYVRDCDLYGVRLSGGSDGNTISENTFVFNNGSNETYDAAHIQAYDEGGNDWNSVARGNYWTDWTSPDANHDSIVDVDYVIAGGDSLDEMPMAASDLYSPPKVGDIDGYVIDSEGTVISGVIVWLSGGQGTVTDAYGHFSFANVTEGTYTVTFAKANYTTGSANVTVTDGDVENMGEIELSHVTEADTSNDDTLIPYAALGIVVVVAIAAIVLMYFRMRPSS